MPSPFPGMDPYLEYPGWWPDFHRKFITFLSIALADRLPNDYDARIDEQIRVVVPDEPATRYYPDVGVTRGPGDSAGGSPTDTGTAVALEPVLLTELEEVRDVWLEVRHHPDRSLVTVIEVLSPSNKVGSGLQDYTTRRDQFLHEDVNFVEINLLVGGQRPPIGSAWPPSDYYALVARGEQHPRAGLKRWSVRDPLPTIPIPLRPADQDVPLDLAPIFTTTYDGGRYARFVNYTEPPFAPLATADRIWAADLGRAFRTGSAGQAPPSPSA